jgi:hypothetical protein
LVIAVLLARRRQSTPGQEGELPPVNSLRPTQVLLVGPEVDPPSATDRYRQ